MLLAPFLALHARSPILRAAKKAVPGCQISQRELERYGVGGAFAERFIHTVEDDVVRCAAPRPHQISTSSHGDQCGYVRDD